MPGPPPVERRRAPRARVGVEAAYEDSERQVFLRTYDISEDGVFLLAAEAPAPGATARLTLALPGHPALLRLTGIVVRRAAQPHAGLAVAFDRPSLSLEVRAVLRRFVERHASAG